MNDKKPSTLVQPQDKFVIRFPDGMRDRIAEAAAKSGRSMNAEIVQRLEESFPVIESELLNRRVEETRRLAEEANASDDYRKRLEDQLRGLIDELRVKNAAEDPRTRDLYARVQQALERTNFLDELHQRFDNELQFLLKRVKPRPTT